jgi:hypothetical protein
MERIYRRATVSVAAACAERVSEGFLHQRLKPDAICLPIYTPESTQGQGVVSLLRHEWISGDSLTLRGWCFEEALLSCRRLSYRKDGLFWSCPQETEKPVVE